MAGKSGKAEEKVMHFHCVLISTYIALACYLTFDLLASFRKKTIYRVPRVFLEKFGLKLYERLSDVALNVDGSRRLFLSI